MTARVAGAALAASLFLAPASASATAGDGAPEGRYREFGDAGGFLNIIPPGQDGTLDQEQLGKAQAATETGDFGAMPAHLADQHTIYEDLAFGSLAIGEGDVGRYFKDASFGVRTDDIDRVYEPHPDVTVIRDRSFGVPHIYGRTRYATIFAEGYTTGEDRLFFMDVVRHLGRGRLAELVGAPLAEMDRNSLVSSPYTEEDLERQIDRLADSGDEGAAAVADLEAYAEGVNAFREEALADPSRLPVEYSLLRKQPEEWKTTDAVAIAALVGGLFGRGGGNELDNFCGLRTLEQRLGDTDAAREVFDDLHFADHPEAPTTSQRAATTTTRDTTDPEAVPGLDCETLQPAGAARDPAGLGSGPVLPALDGLAAWVAALRGGVTPSASNAVLVGGEHTDNGRPIAVFGPQVGYQVPTILVEKDVHGPGIDARGVGFLGVDAYVLLGRGRDYAWSATSSGADNVDTFVLRLCDPAGSAPTVDSVGYEHDGRCRPLDRYDHVVDTTSSLGGGDPVTITWQIERAPDYGPVVRRGALTDGTPIAIAERRSTYGAELDSAIGFKRLNDPRYMARGFDAFRDATGTGIDYTFNWFYVDATTIGYQHSCRCPQRAEGVDPDLPAWGTGEWDWRGFVGREAQPFDANPDRGWITSWNNRQAPGYPVSDGQFSYGPVQRVQLLDAGVEAAIDEGNVSRADVVALMADAATADLRARAVLALALEVMGTEPSGVVSDPRLLDARERLEVWSDGGAYRRDTDRDGAYEDATALAIMDAWWPELTRVVFGPSGEPFEALAIDVDDHPGGHAGSAWNSGAYSHVQQDLRLVLGETVDGGWTEPYCGRAEGGNETACAAVLWGSLGAAIGALEQEFGSPDVATWQRRPADDQIEYTQLLVGLPAMQWVNRPTFQQVVQLETRGEAERSDDAGGDGGGSAGATAAVAVVAIGAVVAGGVVAGRRARRARP